MRRRDLVFLCLIWTALLGGLAWALATQARWVKENRPIGGQALPQVEGDSNAKQAPPPAVLGTIDDDTRASMAKGLESKVEPKPADKAKGRAGR